VTASLLVSHSFEQGTLVTGTSHGDGSADVLRAQRLRWSRSLGACYVPRSRDRPARAVETSRIAQYRGDVAAARRSRGDLLAEAEAQLDYWTTLQEQLVAAGLAHVWQRSELAVGDLVCIRGRWSVVAKLNPKTIAVDVNMPGPLEYPYYEITAARCCLTRRPS